MHTLTVTALGRDRGEALAALQTGTARLSAVNTASVGERNSIIEDDGPNSGFVATEAEFDSLVLPLT